MFDSYDMKSLWFEFVVMISSLAAKGKDFKLHKLAENGQLNLEDLPF